jgi:uncharacterized protein YlxW (UPF0749 family)
MNAEFGFRSKRPLPFILLLAAAGIGFYLSLPISGLGRQEEPGDIVSVRSQLPSGVAAERDIELLKDEVESERQKAGRYEKELLEEKEYSQFLLNEVWNYKELAGMTAVTGPGIIVTLSEGTGDGESEWAGEAFLIHQEDLLNIINELWHNDAEAVAVGTAGRKMERVTTFTPVRCSGGAIEINGRRMFPPFEIYAIGDNELLKSVLQMRGGYLQKLKTYGVHSEVITADRIYIPAYRGPTHLLYARSVIEEVAGIDSDETSEGNEE